jgi:chromosome partitioning protein
MQLTIPQASEFYKIPDSTLYEFLSSGKIKNYGTDKRKLIDGTELRKNIPIVIALYSMKGGIGKTATSRSAAYHFANNGLKVLLIGSDPQQNLEASLKNVDVSKEALYNILEKIPRVQNKNQLFNEYVQKVNDNIDIIPASLSLVSKHKIESDEIVPMKKYFLNFFGNYNIIIIDCPPNFTGLSKFGLILANYVFIPINPTLFAYDGLKFTLEKMIEILEFNHTFWDYKLFFNKIEKKEPTTRQYYIEKFSEQFSDKLMENYIPKSAKIEDSHTFQNNLFKDYPNDSMMKQIKEFFNEFQKNIYEENNE